MASVELRRQDIESETALTLILELNAELEARYPEPGANHFRLDPAEVAAGTGAFFVAFVDGVATGCGAVRRIGPSEAEIKRMYVRPGARRLGLGRRLLEALEREAKSLGCTRLVLETGERQPEAIGLYMREGFVAIPAYGEYIDSPLSYCMAKDLV